jgi:aminoglycoside phosphotransferase
MTKADWQSFLPIPLQQLLQGADWRVDTWGSSGTQVYHIGQHFLKIAFYQSIPLQTQSILEAEMVRLQWFYGRIPVPEVQYYGQHEPYEFLLLSEIPGLVSCDKVFSTNIPSVVPLLAQGLQILHSTDKTGCPFDATINTQLEQARQYIAHQLIDPTTFPPEFQGMHPQEVYALALGLRPLQEEVVLTHGDYCLPNILLDRPLSRIKGFIDWGHGGLADPYQDLALAARSVTRNFGKQWVPLLFEAYGLPDPDQDKLRFYRAMDALTL